MKKRNKGYFLVVLLLLTLVFGKVTEVNAEIIERQGITTEEVSSEQDLGCEYPMNYVPDESLRVPDSLLENQQTQGQDEIPLDKASAYASSYDPRKTGKVTPIKNQGQWGLCWDYSAMATIESSLIASGFETNSVDLSELFSAYFAYKEDRDGLTFTEFCKRGGNTSMVYDLLKKGTGPVRESTVPMTTITDSTTVSETLRFSHLYTLESIEYIAVTSSNLEQVKQAIMEHGGVSAQYAAAFEPCYKNNPDGSGDTSYYCYVDNPNIDHGIEIIGWNDNYSASNFTQKPAGNGAWLVKNSWGAHGFKTTTGTGYYWISYYDKGICRYFGSALSFRKNDNYDNLIKYEGSNIYQNNTGKILKLNCFTYGNTNFEPSEVALYINPVMKTGTNCIVESYNRKSDTVTLQPITGSPRKVDLTGCNAYVLPGEKFGIEIKTKSGSSTGYLDPALYPIYMEAANIVNASTVTLDQTSLDLTVQETATLNATVDSAATLKWVTWSSADESVATVSEKGVVTGCGLGTTIITATSADGKASASCTVTVTANYFDKEKIYIEENSQDYIRHSDAYAEWKEAVIFETSDETVAHVYDRDTIPVLITNRHGVCEITAKTKSGKTIGTCKVVVSCSGIENSYSNYTIETGKTDTLTITHKCHKPVMDPSNYTWYSCNTNVVTVDENGNITAMNPGNTRVRVTCSYSGKSYYTDISIKVVKYADSIQLSESSLNLTVGQGLYLYTTIDQTATEKTVTWKSSNDSVATVTASGFVDATGVGTATITATPAGGKVSATCVVQVTDGSGNSGSDQDDPDNPGGNGENTDNSDNSQTENVGGESGEPDSIEVELGAFTYNICDGKATLIKANKNIKTANVANTVFYNMTYYPVTEIAANAFKDCKKLKKVEIGSGIEKIGDKAFYGCKNLKSIKIKTKVLKTVGKGAFKKINKAASIRVPSSKKKKYTKLLNKKCDKTVKIR